jgi:membrane protein
VRCIAGRLAYNGGQMSVVWRNLRGALSRVFPDAQTHAQAAAFNSFLALIPILLVILGVLTLMPRLGFSVADVTGQLQTLLPSTSRVLVDQLVDFGGEPLKWILLGAGGALLAGTGAMSCLMQGFRVVYRERSDCGFWREQWRGLGLLSITVVPWLASVVITVFGRQLRGWMVQHFGLSAFFHLVWLAVYTSLALVLAVLTLATVYHFGRGRKRDWNSDLPGAIVATVLWWVVNVAFGYYVRRVPYSVVYGSLAAAIGLLIWMYLSALVVYLGAAYNAEALDVRPSRRREDAAAGVLVTALPPTANAESGAGEPGMSGAAPRLTRIESE